MRRSVRHGLFAALTIATSPIHAGVVSQHGALKVSGNHIVDAAGTPIQIAGMSLYWSTFGGTSASWGGNSFFNSSVVSTLANDWKSSVVRAPAGVMSGSNQYVYNYPSTMNLVKQVVDAAIANDIYVIVDWHSENSDPKQSDAVTFFTEMANAYPTTPNIIWEIWNEPTTVTWSTVKTYAQTIIPIIRAKSSNLIICGTPTWSQDVDKASQDKLSDANTAYTLHFYAGTHGAALRTKGESALNNGVALFITEWGTTTSDGAGSTIYSSESDTWLSWAKSKGISWANWSMSNKSELSAALKTSASTNGGWSTNDLSSSGAYVKPKIKEVYDALPAASSVVASRSEPLAGEFVALRDADGLTVVAPLGTRRVDVLDPSGRVLASAPARIGEQRFSLDARGLVVVRAVSAQGSRSISTVLTR
jgi:endoglucanase